MRTFPFAAPLLLALAACSSGSTEATPTPPPTTLSPTVAPTPTVTASATVSPTPSGRASASASAKPTPVRTTSKPVETAPPPGAPTCKAAALTLTDADMVVTQTTREEVFVVRTNGPDCGLTGFPTVTLKGSDGRSLTVTYIRDGSTPGSYSLSKGTSVSFSLTSSRTGACVDAASISAGLPGTGGILTAATTTRVCRAEVTVSPIRRLMADS